LGKEGFVGKDNGSKKLLGLGFSLLLSVILPTLALADEGDIYFYKTLAIRSQFADCSQEALALGQRFHEATGLEVVSSVCSDRDSKAVNFTVSYLATKKVVPLSAVFAVLPSTALETEEAYQGIFSQPALCLGAAAEYSRRYTSETGLPVVAAYCQQSFLGASVLRIDGFGSSRRVFYNSGYQLDLPASASKEMISAVGDLLSKVGATSVQFATLGNYLAAMYYAPEGLDLNAYFIPKVGWMSNQAQCEEERAFADRFFQSLGNFTLTSSCLKDAESGAWAFALVFAGRLPIVKTDYWVKPGPVYSTPESCRKDRDRITKLLGGEAALCTLAHNSTNDSMTVLGR
jgi:hypothetical protein